MCILNVIFKFEIYIISHHQYVIVFIARNSQNYVHIFVTANKNSIVNMFALLSLF